MMCVAAPAHAAAGGETSGGETAEIEPNAKKSLGTPADAHGGRVCSVGSGPPHVLGLGICPHTCPNFAEFRVSSPCGQARGEWGKEGKAGGLGDGRQPALPLRRRGGESHLLTNKTHECVQ